MSEFKDVYEELTFNLDGLAKKLEEVDFYSSSNMGRSSILSQIIKLIFFATDKSILQLTFYKEPTEYKTPYFEVTFKEVNTGYYSINPIKRLTEQMPEKFEEQILIWAAAHSTSLNDVWNKIQKSEQPSPFKLYSKI